MSPQSRTQLDGRQTLAGEKPWLVAFTLGLLHGPGFAGALSRIGPPQTEIPLSPASFNVGVELAQVAFVAVVLGLPGAFGKRAEWPLACRNLVPYAIRSVSASRVIERIWTITTSSRLLGARQVTHLRRQRSPSTATDRAAPLSGATSQAPGSSRA